MPLDETLLRPRFFHCGTATSCRPDQTRPAAPRWVRTAVERDLSACGSASEPRSALGGSAPEVGKSRLSVSTELPEVSPGPCRPVPSNSRPRRKAEAFVCSEARLCGWGSLCLCGRAVHRSARSDEW